MPYIVIAIIILVIGASAEIVAYVFTDRLLKKREDGLDRRKAALDAAASVIFAEKTRKLVRVCGRTSFSREDCIRAIEHGTAYSDFKERWIDAAKYRVCGSLMDKMTVFQEVDQDGRMIIRAELWVAEGGPDGVS